MVEGLLRYLAEVDNGLVNAQPQRQHGHAQAQLLLAALALARPHRLQLHLNLCKGVTEARNDDPLLSASSGDGSAATLRRSSSSLPSPSLGHRLQLHLWEESLEISALVGSGAPQPAHCTTPC